MAPASLTRPIGPTRPILDFCALACSLLPCFAGAAAPGARDDAEPRAPILVAKGQDFLVHAVAGTGSVRRAWLGVQVAAGSVILYTKPSTGEMKALVTTGTWEHPTERISYSQSRLVGVACDAERLYALVWSARMWDRPAYSNESLQKIRSWDYTLSVFWLADGAPIDRFVLVPLGHTGRLGEKAFLVDELPDAVPVETVDHGPLRAIGRGVACRGLALEFDGRRFVRSYRTEAERPAGPRGPAPPKGTAPP